VTNPSKRKGDRFELAVAKALRLLGYPHAERTRAGWAEDRGDINAAPGLVVQCKDVARKEWGVWLRELADQVRHARADHGVLVVKQRGNPNAAEALAVMTLEDWTRLARAAGYGVPLADDTAEAEAS
jgi:hypothetical protein